MKYHQMWQLFFMLDTEVRIFSVSKLHRNFVKKKVKNFRVKQEISLNMANNNLKRSCGGLWGLCRLAALLFCRGGF